MPRSETRRRAEPREPLSLQELREIQTRCQGDPDVIALLWEIRRLRGVISQADIMRRSVETAWREEVGGQLSGLWQLQVLLTRETGM